MLLQDVIFHHLLLVARDERVLGHTRDHRLLYSQVKIVDLCAQIGISVAI